MDNNKDKHFDINKDEFFEKVLERFTEEITDQVFLYIEKDKYLNEQYLKLTENKTEKDEFNQEFGRKVKYYFELEDIVDSNNVVQKCTRPKSTLIKAYTKHKK